MKRWFWIFAAIAISTGVYFTIRYGLRPKPIPVIDPTEFSDLEQVGVVIYKRLRLDIRSERVVLLGSNTSVQDNAKIWAGLIKAAAADKEKLVLFTTPGTFPEDLAKHVESVPLDDSTPTSEALLSRLKAQLKAGRLILVHSSTREVSHFVNGSLSRQVEQIVQHPVLSLSTMRLPLTSEERERTAAACAASDGTSETGESRLACAAQRVGRKFARKNLDPAKLWTVMERHGLKEYLVFVNLP